MHRDIDLRKEILELLKNNRYQILLQKTSKKIRCSCFSEKYQESITKCPKCTGTGWLFKFEKHKSFKQDYTNSPDVAILFTDIGQLSHAYRIFYFAHDVHPQVGDYIWEVSWKNSKPVQVQTLFQIKEVSEQRGESGKIEFFMVLAKKDPIDKDFKNNYIGKAWRGV